MDDHLDARIADATRLLRRTVRGRVVNDVDAIDEVGDAPERLGDEILLLVGRHDNRDALALDH